MGAIVLLLLEFGEIWEQLFTDPVYIFNDLQAQERDIVAGGND